MGLAKTALAIGIALVFAVFFSYGLFAVYEPPRYDYSRGDCYTKFDCENFTRECYKEQMNRTEKEPIPLPDDCYQKAQSNPEYARCMEARDDCEKAFEKTTDRYKHSRNSFYVLFVIALGAIITGIMLNKLESIGSGLIGGGVLVLLWSLIYTAQFWITWNKFVKLSALGLVLVVLVYLGYKRVEQHTTKKKR